MDRTGWRLGDPHPHRPAHGGLKGYNSLMFLLAIPIIPRTKTTTTKVEQYRYWNRLSNTSAVSLDRLLIRHSELPTGGAAM